MVNAIVKIILRGVVGVVMGLIYYLLYVAALPTAFQRIAGLPVSIELPMDSFTILTLFIAFGIAENVTPNLPSAVFRALSKLVGASCLYLAMDGGIVSTSTAGHAVTLDASLIIHIILAGSIIVGVLDATTYACKSVLKK